MPPEMLARIAGGVEGQVADMYALGVCLFTITFGVPPFFNANLSDRYYKLIY